VARPKVPLISRRKALEEALKIIDEEGLDGLSIRRLADKLHVNGASLYHHFANKEEIVVGAAELALAEVRTPTATDESWHTWLPRNSTLLREAMRTHPELIPVIVRRSELGMGREMLDSSAARLVEEGVPLGAVVPLLDALETFALGSAIHETRDVAPASETRSGTILAKAGRARLLSADEIYGVVSRAIVEAVEAAAESKETERATKRSAKTVAKGVTAKKGSLKRTPASKVPATKVLATKAPATKAQARKAQAKKVAAKTAPAKTAPAKSAAAKKAAPRKASARTARSA
jgi:TetR/AcrR family transcriptional regulator, tetracycline repressor protein